MSGWEQKATTFYEYASVVWWKPWTWYRVLRSVVVQEPEWRPEDVALLVASKQRGREYGSHGILMSEALDPANADAFEGSDKPLVDFAEKARMDAEDAYYKQWPEANRHGHIWGVKKRAPK